LKRKFRFKKEAREKQGAGEELVDRKQRSDAKKRVLLLDGRRTTA
jgi:hypothetical protein